jgi:hypothetical protein
MTIDIEKYTIGTAWQKKAYKKLSERWEKVGDPQIASFDNVWMVEVTGETGMTMWLGIEEDGHTHS